MTDTTKQAEPTERQILNWAYDADMPIMYGATFHNLNADRLRKFAKLAYAEGAAEERERTASPLTPDYLELKTKYDKFASILDGVPQDAIDGGWTAKGICQYAKSLEEEIDRLKKVKPVKEPK